MSINQPTRTKDAPISNKSDGRQTELSALRRRLANKTDLLHDDDPDLYQECIDWLDKSSKHPDGSIGSEVNSKLRDLKRGNKMRDHRGVEEGEDAFPPDCEGCEYYGVACPMVGRYSVKNKRERIIRTAETDEELVAELTDLAIDWDCHVVLDVLDTFDQSTGKFLQEGYRLLWRATEVLHIDGDDSGVTAVYDDGPSPEDRERMEETISAVMEEDGGEEA